jgi:hypothetical protein
MFQYRSCSLSHSTTMCTNFICYQAYTCTFVSSETTLKNNKLRAAICVHKHTHTHTHTYTEFLEAGNLNFRFQRTQASLNQFWAQLGYFSRTRHQAISWSTEGMWFYCRQRQQNLLPPVNTGAHTSLLLSTVAYFPA